MEGDLFTETPLTVKGNPARDIAAQQVRESLRSIHGASCAMPDELWQAVWTKCGHDGAPSDAWKVSVTQNVRLFVKTSQAQRPDETWPTPDEASKMYLEQLLAYSHRLLREVG